LEAIRAAGKVPITTNTYDSMATSRYASAVGIEFALQELPESELEVTISSGRKWSSKASCSSGAELEDCHILVLAKTWSSGYLRAVSGFMEDAIDAPTIVYLLDRIKEDHGEVVQVFAKAEADPSGLIRGSRHTMNTDSDIHSTRHARAAVGGLLAGLVGDTQIYVSGGAEGQGPPSGGSLCIVYRRLTGD
jgi:cyanuric acid amidohydrolase